MKIDRLAPATEPPTGPRRAWTRFWFTPIDPTGLHWLRVFAGLLFIVWLLSLAGYEREFFGLKGWFDKKAYTEAARLPGGIPAPIGWSVLYIAGDSDALLQTIYWSSIAVLVLYTIGIATRITAVLTWIIVASFLANPAINYEADYLLALLAFYLMVGHLFLGQWSRPLTPRDRVLGSNDGLVWRQFRRDPRAEPIVSYAANFAIRLLQIHVAIVIITSGLHKLQIAEWWAGVAFWYPLHPPFETTADGIRAMLPRAQSYLFFLTLSQYLVLAWQISFPFFAWRGGRWRVVLLGGAAIGWLGTAFVLGQPLFGPFYAIGCLSFLTPSEWQALLARFRRRPQLVSSDRSLSPARKEQLAART